MMLSSQRMPWLFANEEKKMGVDSKMKVER